MGARGRGGNFRGRGSGGRGRGGRGRGRGKSFGRFGPTRRFDSGRLNDEDEERLVRPSHWGIRLFSGQWVYVNMC